MATDDSGAPIEPEVTLRVRVEAFRIPPIADGLLVGKRSPIGCIALRRTLDLLVPDPFEHIEVPDDEILGDIFVRRPILLRAPKDRLVAFLLRHVKPRMVDTEILHLHLDVQVVLEALL